ncbi:septum formation inhibitor Maf [Sulfuricurvum sp.]|uniref:septum formation inhibitor Maf n=1 Tax=Sulfuricurvum sp. TaxID=2025608 RepID=UPI0026339C81|nr:septum formation inhibitor Maf [Sulfuricurvum sp.]MDD3597816.1 septum formation inhibitor Maf [Sulfuricurvum sp.]
MLRLASASITRAELLRSAGIPFIQESIDFDEDAIIADSPKNFVYQATLGKYRLNLEKFGCEDYPLLVADTVVTAHGKILRKAKDEADARMILQTQSGSDVSIITCMIYKTPRLELLDISSTRYFFDPFDSDALERYLESGEWRGKAGACMVEGFCKSYIREVRGFESTAMGLSVEVLQTFR